MKNIWNAKQYTKFIDLRTRPAIDLLAVIPPTFQPKTIYDLGCGPGNSTILLKNRWPTAHITGIDSSPDMLKEARETYTDMHFVESDIADFTTPEKIDLICANASLQWLDNHSVLLPNLITCLSKMGVLAIQMPNNFHAPSHQVSIRILEGNPAWQPLLKHLRYGILNKPFYHLPDYYDLLTQAGLGNLQLWETEYFQEMADYQAIFNWVSGTGLRPVLSLMSEKEQAIFAEFYINQLANAYPLQKNAKVLLPFRRLFMVGFNQ